MHSISAFIHERLKPWQEETPSSNSSGGEQMKRLLAILLLVGSGIALASQGQQNFGPGSGISITTVAGLANVPAKTKGTIAVVTDGASATDCVTGAGSTVVVCQFNGSAWAQMVAASSGGTAFSAITAGTSAAALVMGTGGSLATSGTGTINANQVNGGTVPLSAPLLGSNASNQPVSVTTVPTSTFPALTGDVTTPGSSLATTIAANAVTGAKMANATVTATQLAAQYSKGSCTEAWGGSGASHALTSGDDAAANNSCYNDSGVTRTITAVKCRNDNAANTTTVNPTFGSAGTGTTILSAALTCGNSNAYSSSGTVTNASWTTGTGINPAMGGTLTGTSIAVIVEFTY